MHRVGGHVCCNIPNSNMHSQIDFLQAFLLPVPGTQRWGVYQAKLTFLWSNIDVRMVIELMNLYPPKCQVNFIPPQKKFLATPLASASWDNCKLVRF